MKTQNILNLRNLLDKAYKALSDDKENDFIPDVYDPDVNYLVNKRSLKFVIKQT